MPDPIPAINTDIEYWYDEEERTKEETISAMQRRHFRKIVPKMFEVGACELVMMFPESFHQESSGAGAECRFNFRIRLFHLTR